MKPLVWTREQRTLLQDLQHWHLPGKHVPAYAPHEIELARRAAVRERVQRRQRIARQLAIAIGWCAP